MKFKVFEVTRKSDVNFTVTYQVFDDETLLDTQSFNVSAALLRLENIENIARTMIINHWYAINNLDAIEESLRKLEFSIGVSENKAYGTS